jgi:hypothetical protein
MLFWVFGALLVWACLYFSCYGAISFHAIVGFTIGALVWYNIWHVYGKAFGRETNDKEKKKPEI